MQTFSLAMQILERHSMQDHEFPLQLCNLGLSALQAEKLIGATLLGAVVEVDTPTIDVLLPRKIIGALKVAVSRLAISDEARRAVPATEVDTAIERARDRAQATIEGADPY